jgi:KDO2-lipid IV(A) lauroyltransferase
MTMLRWLLELQYFLEFLVAWPIVTFVRRASEERSRRLARSLGRVAYRVLVRDRDWCLRNLELVFGANLGAAQRSKLAMRVFEQTFLTATESLRWSREWMEKHVIEVGGEYARQVGREAKRQGKGCILISAHLGNFELIPAWVYYTGWRGPVMYRPQNNWRVERLIQGARREYLEETVPRGPFGLMSLMYALREGKGVGLLVDINTIVGPVFVDFLGFSAASPPGAAALALATGCEVILAMSVRQPDGRHRLVFHPPFELIETGDRKRDIAANTEQYMKAIEPYVLAHPEQYNWLHPRWRLRPDGSVWKLSDSVQKMARERRGTPRKMGTQNPNPSCATSLSPEQLCRAA